MTALSLFPFFQALADLCFPAACLACGRRLASSRPPLFCSPCQQELRFPESPLCACCGVPFPAAAGGDHLCAACLPGRPFSRARAVFLYTPGIARAIHAWKYGKTMAGLASFAFYFTERCAGLALSSPDLIVPVPLHPQRLRQRGFNQAQLLARSFFPGQALHPFLLQRLRATPPQTGLSGEQRRRNTRGAFRVAAPARVAGKAVLLIDDVLTTGATAEECALALRRAGAAEVQVLTLARVDD